QWWRRVGARGGDGGGQTALRAGHPRGADRDQARLPAGGGVMDAAVGLDTSTTTLGAGVTLVTAAHGTRHAPGNEVARELTTLAGDLLGAPSRAAYVELC